MSTIPPNWLSSAVQAHGAQKRAAETNDKERATSGGSGDAKSVTSGENVIQNEDLDSSVDADAEGAGSQGRSHSEPDELEDEPQDSSDDVADSGLDVEA